MKYECFISEEPMRARDLELRELVSFEEGNIDLHGRRLVLHSIHAFGEFCKDVIDMLGSERARRLFTRFGYFWGQADASAMLRILQWEDPLETLRATVRLLGLEGVARPEILSVHRDQDRFEMEILWHDSGESEEHLSEVGWSESAVCWQLVGYCSGAASFCLGQNVYFLEDECCAKGDDRCRTVGRDESSWGALLQQFLPYFEAEDIKGKVAALTEDLKQKTQELIRHKRELARFKKPAASRFIEGRSKLLEEVLQLANRVAEYDTGVLITGETGVGKEVLARHIHAMSGRADGPFVAVNCAALPETLLESELFGHKRGSFTGAIEDRVGLFAQAARGTIFLDEIGDISPSTQLKILRVLQEKEIMRVGESKPRRVDVRVLAATNRNLDQAVADGNFREDLLYRLRVIEIEIPPLRERPDDILPLARHILHKLSRRLGIPELHLDATAVDRLLECSWPGNVRELENALERAAILSRDGNILPEYLPVNVLQSATASLPRPGSRPKTLAEVEMDYIRAVVRSTGGNRTKAAKILGIGATTLWRKLKTADHQQAGTSAAG
jgi:DNA-binding NtrC family response regulator